MVSRGRARPFFTQVTAVVLAVLLASCGTALRRTGKRIASLRAYRHPVAAAECPLTLPAPATQLFTQSRLNTTLNGLCPALQTPASPIFERKALTETLVVPHRYSASRISQGETIYP